jgi:peroxiredoxin Q/BCP
MEAYRDQYATIFNNGRKVVVISISVDADTTQASWARDEDFPMVFASDVGGAVGRKYEAFAEKSKQDNRSLFVVNPEGRIAYVVKPFKVLSAAAYKDLGAVVDSLSPPPPDSTK